MNEETKSPALPTLVTALLLGITGDALLHVAPWGIGTPVWTALFFGGAIALIQRFRPQPIAAMAIPAVGAMTAAIGLAWRDSNVLTPVDIVLFFGFIGLLALGPKGIRLWAAGIVHYCAALLYAFAESLPGMVLFALADVAWKKLPLGRWSRRTLAVVRGLVIALPALLILGALLMSADAEFSGMIRDLVAIDIPRTISHVLLAAAITAICGGFLRSLIRGNLVPEGTRPEFFRLGAIETNTATAAVDLLFAAFVAVQFRYLFGGAALVKSSPSMTYTEYARSGFFELVTVAAIVVPLLLFSEWLIDKRFPRAVRVFRTLAALQVLLVFVIIVSAMKRMRLYTEEFGMTELRLYTTAFMIWLGALLLWFTLTVLRGQRERFMSGALVAGLILVVTLHTINPDDLIVRTNIARATAGRKAFDTSYALTLSNDATPALIESLGALPNDRQRVAARLLDLDLAINGDPRSWNLSRSRAHELVSAHRPELLGWAPQWKAKAR